MNEQIKELAKQAIKDCSSESLYPALVMQGEVGDVFRIPEVFVEKFAELIIHRAMSVYNETDTFKTSVYDDKRVLGYFGIEE